MAEIKNIGAVNPDAPIPDIANMDHYLLINFEYLEDDTIEAAINTKGIYNNAELEDALHTIMGQL